MPERSCDPRPRRRSFGGKVQEHLPTDVYGILQSCEFIIHGARFSEEKHTGRWRTGNWPERLRCTKSGEIVIMLLTLDRTCPTLAHWVTPKQVHTWFQTSFIPTSQCCTISMMCKRAVGLPAHLGRQLRSSVASNYALNRVGELGMERVLFLRCNQSIEHAR